MDFKRNQDPLTSLDVGINSKSYEKIQQEKFKESLNTVISFISKDSALFYAYQANIAMAALDAEDQYIKKHHKKYLNRKDKHTIFNEGAKNFLNIFCR